ncbi:MAG TPA: hypothetical protein VGG16_05135 [Streptosporangiaceae bacterium]
MTAQPSVLPIPAADPAERAEPLSDRAALTLAGLYYLLAAALVTWWLWRDPASRMVAGNYNDADQMAWFFRFDATAIAHFHLPALVTTGMNAPQGVNVMWNTFMLLPGTVLAPVTLLAGPQTSLTVLMTIGFAGSALAMCAVLRHWQVSRPAAMLAGAVYAFSPALLHSAIGHYDLQFAVFLPLIVDAALRLLAGHRTPVRGGLWLGLVVVMQLFVNEEMVFDTALTALIIVLVWAARRGTWRAIRTRAKPVAQGLGVAVGIIAVVAGYPLWIQFFGPLPQSGSPFTLDFFKNDLSGLVVPSSLMFFHTGSSAQFAAHFQGQLPEYLAYLGVPLIVVLVLGAVRFWRRPMVRACAVAWVVTEVLSLGGTLLAAGHEYSQVKLPWYWVQGLPLLSSAIPDRFSIVADGAAAALLAFLIDAAVPVVKDRLPGLVASGRKPLVVVMSCAALAVVPLVPKPLPPTDATPLPAGWTAAFTSLNLPASANVLVVPIPSATFTAPLRWQADSGQPRAMVGGYYMGPAWNGHVYIDGDGTPQAGIYLNALWSFSAASIPADLSAQFPAASSTPAGKSAPAAMVTDAQMLGEIVTWDLSAVVAVTVPRSVLGKYLSTILGRPSVVTGDVMAWRV